MRKKVTTIKHHLDLGGKLFVLRNQYVYTDTWGFRVKYRGKPVCSNSDIQRLSEEY